VWREGRELGAREILAPQRALEPDDGELNEQAEPVGALLRPRCPGRSRPLDRSGFVGLPCPTLARFCMTSRYGFTLHAATRAGGSDDTGREALLRYVLRPPIAQERVEPQRVGWSALHSSVRTRMARSRWTWTMDPVSLLCRLATAVPPPRYHTVKYAGSLPPPVVGARASRRLVPTPLAQRTRSKSESQSAGEDIDRGPSF
jgi:hypothetical protein